MSALAGTLVLDRRAAGRWAVWAVTTAAAFAMWTVWVGAGEPGGPACLLRQLLHVDCPTCGITRALALLARGEWRASLAVHPWAVALVLQAIVGWLAWARWVAQGGAHPERWIPHAVAANGIALLMIWAVRLATGTLPG